MVRSKKGIQPSPDARKEMTKFAETCIQKGKHDAAFYFLNEFLKAHGPNADAFYLKAVTLNLIGNHADAIINALCCLDIDGDHYKAAYEAAKAYHVLQNYDKAVFHYEKVFQAAKEYKDDDEKKDYYPKVITGKWDCYRSVKICLNCNFIKLISRPEDNGFGICRRNQRSIEYQELCQKYCDAYEKIHICKNCFYISLSGIINESLPFCDYHKEFISRTTYWRSRCDEFQVNIIDGEELHDE